MVRRDHQVEAIHPAAVDRGRHGLDVVRGARNDVLCRGERNRRAVVQQPDRRAVAPLGLDAEPAENVVEAVVFLHQDDDVRDRRSGRACGATT